MAIFKPSNYKKRSEILISILCKLSWCATPELQAFVTNVIMLAVSRDPRGLLNPDLVQLIKNPHL